MTRLLAPIPRLALLFALCAGPALAQDAPRPGAAPSLTVTGDGTMSVKPDRATVSVGVVQEADTAAAALAAMNAAAIQVLGRLAAAGIAQSDIQTGQLSLDPRYGATDRDGMSVVNGFIATTMYDVRVRDLALLGGVLDAVVADGANRLGNIQFGVADPGPLLDEARRAAVADAQARADVLSDAAGVTLGSIRSIAESSGGGMPQPMMEMRMMAADAIAVSGGEVALTAQVTLVYDIGQ